MVGEIMKKPRYIKDISGKKKGRLTAIKFVERVDKKSLWLFKCDCGKEKVLIGSSVMRDKVKSCGCMVVEHAHKNGQKFTLPADASYKNRIYRSYSRSAKVRLYGFDISKESFIALLSMRCYYCNLEPSNIIQEGNKEQFFYNGVDRKNNGVGYSEENCVACCGTCNKMKMNMNVEEFIQQVRSIAKNTFEGR